MAQQKGIIKIRGTVGDLTFYKSQDGYLVKAKTSLDGDRIGSAPSFARTRENIQEFSASAGAGKMLRRALNSLMLGVADSRISSRVTKLMTLIKNLDPVSARGRRSVVSSVASPASKTQFKGFEFNAVASLSSLVKQPITVNIATGAINIASLTPLTDLVAPEGATHAVLTGAWLRLDFGTGSYDLQTSPPLILPMSNVAAPVALIPPAVPAGVGTDLFLLRIDFTQIINGIQYPLNNGKNNALSIVEVA